MNGDIDFGDRPHQIYALWRNRYGKVKGKFVELSQKNENARCVYKRLLWRSCKITLQRDTYFTWRKYHKWFASNENVEVNAILRIINCVVNNTYTSKRAPYIWDKSSFDIVLAPNEIKMVWNRGKIIMVFSRSS